VDWSDEKLIEFLYWKIFGNVERCAELYAAGYKDKMVEYIEARRLGERRGFVISRHVLSPLAKGRLNTYADEESSSRWNEMPGEAKRVVERQTSQESHHIRISVDNRRIRF